MDSIRRNDEMIKMLDKAGPNSERDVLLRQNENMMKDYVKLAEEYNQICQ